MDKPEHNNGLSSLVAVSLPVVSKMPWILTPCCAFNCITPAISSSVNEKAMKRMEVVALLKATDMADTTRSSGAKYTWMGVPSWLKLLNGVFEGFDGPNFFCSN